jgi:two-component system, cell cycle sensor histidine kinase and response regulator CckA
LKRQPANNPGTHPRGTHVHKAASFPALRIAGIYILVGVLWILGTDELMTMTVLDPITLTRISILKGWGFVIASGLLIHYLMRRELSGRIQVEETLRAGESRYRSLFENMLEGYVYCQIIVENGKLVDFVFVHVNDVFERLTGLKDAVGKKASEVIPGLRENHSDLLDIHGRVALTGIPERFEVYVDRLGMWFAASVYCPEPGHFVSVFDNITERRRAEDALRESEERYRRLVEQVPAITYTAATDKNSTTVYVSPQVEMILGYSQAEYREDPDLWRGNLHPDDRDRVLAEVSRCHDAGEPFLSEYRMTAKDGRIVWFRDQAALMDDETGGRRLQGLMLDITDRKQAELRLQHEKDKLKTILDNMNDGVYIVDSQYDVQYVNPVLEAACGPVKDRKCHEYLHNRTEPCPRCKTPEVLAGQTVLREWYSERTGKNFEVFATPIRNDDGSVSKLAFFHDITARTRAEEMLRMSEERYRAIFDNASVGIDLVDGRGRFLQVNDALAEMLGYSKEEMLSMSIFDITHPEDTNVSQTQHDKVVSGQIPSYRFEKRYVRKDGEVLWADLAVSIVRDASGGYAATIGVISDISERVRAEAERQRLASAIEQAAEMVVITGPEGDIQYVNPAFERVTGFTRGEALGRNPRFLKSGQHDSTFYEDLWNTIKRGATWSGRMINRKKDGTPYYEEGTISPVRDGAGKITNFVAVKHDVTDHLERSKQLFQAQKMEAVATLAGGVAHDFNNLLQVVQGFSELLLADKSKDDQDFEDILKIHQAALSGADLVRSLLTFGRKIEPKPSPLNLNKQIKHVESLLRRTIPKMINIQLEPAKNLRRISADQGQMEQILVNLAINARDAMPDGGTLTIGTQDVTLNPLYCRLHAGVKPGPHVVLLVSDTGHGMDRRTMEHMFEPFFTTKELGRGTGLGLAMVHGIVQQHGGHVTCQSELGRGTTFRVYLPALSTEGETVEESAVDPPATGTETVLLVDDEDLVRELAGRMLKKKGYSVLTAANGMEALDVYAREKDRIALVILDLIMPTMGGKDCLKKMLDFDPGAKVLIASGHAADSSTRECIALGAKGFVAKPFRSNDLLQGVRKTLDED